MHARLGCCKDTDSLFCLADCCSCAHIGSCLFPVSTSPDEGTLYDALFVKGMKHLCKVSVITGRSWRTAKDCSSAREEEAQKKACQGR